MPIALEDDVQGGTPVVKRRVIGEKFVGAIVKHERRQVIKDDKPQFKENGKARYELVVHLLAVKGDAHAGIGGTEAVPTPGDSVRAILRGGAYGEWIDASNTFKAANGRGVSVGDLLSITTTHAIRYRADSSGTELGTLDTAAAVDEWRTTPANMNRTESLGFRGGMVVGIAEGENAQWVPKAEEAYHAFATQGISLDDSQQPAAAGGHNEDPF